MRAAYHQTSPKPTKPFFINFVYDQYIFPIIHHRCVNKTSIIIPHGESNPIASTLKILHCHRHKDLLICMDFIRKFPELYTIIVAQLGVLLSALIVAEQYRFYYKSQDRFDGIMTLSATDKQTMHCHLNNVVFIVYIC